MNKYCGIVATIWPSCVTLHDSHKIKKIKVMKKIIKEIREDHPNCALNKRSMFSLINEWRAHNLVYTLIPSLRERTGSVDLNLDQPWWVSVAYFILSMGYLRY